MKGVHLDRWWASFVLLLMGFDGVIGPEFEPVLNELMDAPEFHVFSDAQIEAEGIVLRGEGIRLELARPSNGSACGPFSLLASEGLSSDQVDAICRRFDGLDDPFRPGRRRAESDGVSWTDGRVRFHPFSSAALFAVLGAVLFLVAFVVILRAPED